MEMEDKDSEDKRKPKILIVEDDSKQAKTLANILEAEGYSSLAVLTGEEGVAAAKEEDVSLVLIDLKLPNISGIISKRKQMDDDALRAEYKKLVQQDKMKRDTLNEVYHEMRSPLVSIVGYASLLEQSELSDKQKKYVRIIEESSSLLDGVINRMLEVTRIENGKAELILEPVSIAEIVNDVIERIKPRVDAKKQMISTAVPEGIEVEGDKQKVTAIFDNLISNAVKYTGENGRIDIAVENSKEAEGIRVCVADTGSGISKEHLPKVFDRFYTANTSLTRKESLGLGLTIVKGYVEQHGGAIWATSEPGKGSKFFFTLPKKQR